MSTIRPLYDRIVIKRDEVETVSAGGIYVAGGLDDKPEMGTVIAAGPGGVLPDGTVRPTTVKPGDRVIVSKGTGAEISIDGEMVLVVSEPEIVGIVS
jgi:chaperonin GroES